MSIRDRVEAAKAGEQRKQLAREKAQQRDEEESKAFFKPVYDAFLELEKEYGSGRGVKFSVADYMCTIRPEKGLEKLQLSCFYLSPNKITIEETMDFSITPDGGIMENREELNNAKEAIDIAIKYVTNHIK